MATVFTTTNTTPLQYPSNTLMDRRASNGHLYVMSKSSTADQYVLYRSTDSGGSWSLFVTRTRTGMSDLGSIFFDTSGWLRWVYRVTESSLDKIYISGMDVSRSSPSWEPELLLGSAASGTYFGLDCWNVVTSGREYFAVAVGKVVGSAGGVEMLGAYTPSIPGTTISDPTVIMQTRQWLVDGTGRQTPSLDGQHNGDGKTASSPNLWLTFGRTSLRLCKLTWNGDGWNGPSSPVTIQTGMTARNYAPGLWDGQRFLMVAPSITNADRVDLFERNQANSATTKRTTPSSHPTGNITAATVDYDSSTRNVRIFAVGTSTTVLYSITYTRAADTWSGWSTVSATALLGVDQFTRRRGTTGRGKYDVVTAHSGAPNTVVHTAQSITYTPVTPTWEFDAVPWTNGSAVDVAASLFVDWTFNATDPGDVQTAYSMSRQIGAGTLAYWRASDSTWQPTEVQNNTSSTSFNIPAAWGLDADAAHTYKVKTYNAGAVASAYSDPLIVIPSAKVNPTITAPAAAAVITADSVLTTWTATQQTAYQVQASVGGVVFFDTGKVAGSATSATVTGLTDSTSVVITVWTWNNEGLQSNAVTVSVTVDFVEPAIASATLAAIRPKGTIRVTIANPTPTGGQPVVASNTIYRRLAVGDSSNGIPIAKLIANNGVYDDWQVASRTDYAYRIVTFGVNGTSITSGWLT